MAVDKDLFRQAAGSFASGVTVITTGSDGTYHGLTASAFTSVSLDPIQILVCIDRASHALPLLQASGHFNVNVLSDGQENLSRIFASKDAPERETFDGIDFRIGELGAPVLKNTAATFECRVASQFDGGDHVIVIGVVEHAKTDTDALPLLYFRGRYRHLADE